MEEIPSQTASINEVNQTVVASSEVPGTSILLPTSAPEEMFSLQSMSESQRERYYYLSSLYDGPISLMILENVSQYHLNTWSSLCVKMDFITDKRTEDPYYNAIFNEIEINRDYLFPEIIRTISRLRKSFNLKPYHKGNIGKHCINDFFMMHMAEPVWSKFVDDNSGKPIILGYKPIINLTSQL
ncbi:MAG: hypothetical protein EOO91_02005 [Pedobacter sp.]|nr:MAG: hypothetical protein EOO91_02005 [Pedobacter sp.]